MLEINNPIIVTLDVEDVEHLITELSYTVAMYEDTKKVNRIKQVIEELKHALEV